MASESKTMWLYRPVLNELEVYQWAKEIGIKKMLPPGQLHLTLATCRTPVDWSELKLLQDTIEVEAGHKTIQIFGYTAKAIAFGHPGIKARHEELKSLFPTMDHASMLRPHVTLMRGGKMPREPYLGRLVFGPEVVEEFNETAVKTIKHWSVDDALNVLKAG